MSSEIGQANGIFLRVLYLGPWDSLKRDVDLERRRV